MTPPHAHARHAAIAIFIALATAACSISNVHRDDCTNNAQCAATFGPGSVCEDGFCAGGPSPDCLKKDATGHLCVSCAPKTAAEFQSACTAADCKPFDAKRLTKLEKDGGLPPLP